jgi:hypothetical protein
MMTARPDWMPKIEAEIRLGDQWMDLDTSGRPSCAPKLHQPAEETLPWTEMQKERHSQIWARWSSITHRNIRTGEPCDCTFYMPPKMVKTASKLDWLRKRPDMQTEEGAKLLELFEIFEKRHPQIDPLLPWLAREVKKGNLILETSNIGSSLGIPTGHGGILGQLNPGRLAHWGDWLADKKAPNRQGFDLMQHDISEVSQKVIEYDEWLQSKENEVNVQQAKSAPVAHQYDDGWTLRKLRPEDLEYEGDAMGHCVGSYDDAVRTGRSLIYSLRDPKHIPHTTLELTPNEAECSRCGWHGKPPTEPARCPNCHFDAWEGSPKNSSIVQIQGKSDEEPKPEYQERLKQWFETFDPKERPYWDGDEIGHLEELTAQEEGRPNPYNEYGGGYGSHGDYGVETKSPIDYDEVLHNLSPKEWGYRAAPPEGDINDLYMAALKRGEIPQLAEAAEPFSEEQQDSFDEWREMNYEHTVPYSFEDGDEEYPLKLPNGEEVETPEEHEKAYYEDLKNWERDHPGMQMTSELYKSLRPHWGIDANGKAVYVNTIQPDPTAYVRSGNPTPLPYWQHPAQRMWEAGELSEHPAVPLAISPATPSQ